VSALALNLPVCHRCPRRPAECAGACPCAVDGRDIADHAARGDCPEGRFAPRGPLPVDARMLEGYEPTPDGAVSGGCGCAGDQQRAADSHVVVVVTQAQDEPPAA
jgi:hypothetical protein